MRHSWLKLLLLVLAMLLAVIEIRIATRHGVGISPDSVVYIASARHLIEGRGYTVPTPAGKDVALTQFPPGYPLLVSVIVRVFPNHFFECLPWLNALLFAGLIGLIGVWVYRITGQSMWISGLATGLVLSGPDFLRVYSMLWSETVFCLLVLTGLWMLSYFLQKPVIWRLWAAALCIASAWMTRYAGMPIVLSGVIILLLADTSGWRKRLQHAVLFGTVAGFPMALWLVRNYFLTHNVAARHIAFHPQTDQLLAALQNSLSLWLMQGREVTPAWALGIGGCLLLGWIFLLIQVLRRPGRSPALTVLLIFGTVYGLFILIVSCFLEAQLLSAVEFDRILSPLHLTGILVLSGVVGRLRRTHVLSGSLVGVVLLVGITGVSGTVSRVRALSADGQQYAGHNWQISSTLNEMRSFSDALHIYSNGQLPIYLYTNRFCYEMPAHTFVNTLQSNPQYVIQMARIRDEVQRRTAIVVYFHEEARPEHPTPADLARLLDVQPRPTADAVIYARR